MIALYTVSILITPMTSSHPTSVSDLPLGNGVQALASSRHGLIALEKPAGLMSHPNCQGRHDRCLLAAEYDYEKEVYFWKAGDAIHHVWLLNRLDSPTSGVILLALNETLVPVIRQLFVSHKVQKTYHALVKNTPLPSAGCWKDTLKQDAYKGAKVSKSESEHFARTHYQVISESSGDLPVSLVKLMPVTGRTHQLRIQCHYHRHPIVGDRTHGDFTFNRKVSSATGQKRMMLHASEIALSYHFQGRKYNFHANSELPEPFTELMDINLKRGARN